VADDAGRGISVKKSLISLKSEFGARVIATLGVFGTLALTAYGIVSTNSNVWLSDATRSSSPGWPIEIPSWIWIVLLGLLLLAVVVAGILGYLGIRVRQAEAQAALEAQARELAAFDSAVDRLREKMTLPSLVELNRLMLDRYHSIATGQASTSYSSSKRAMWFGFSWLVACSAAGVTIAASTGDRVILASLAAIGGGLSAFLSRTYITVYKHSLDQLNQYFSQPLLNSYYLTAERIIENMENERDRDQARTKLVTELLKDTRTAGRDGAKRNNGRQRPDRKASKAQTAGTGDAGK
jgi:hypothetical protein